MNDALRLLVRRRAEGRCEYCRFPERESDTPFQVDHIRARQHRGRTHPSNLALACIRCNLFKGTNPSAFDPVTDSLVPLFHPRNEEWVDHFEKKGGLILGLTTVGRATIELLDLNESRIVQHRLLLAREGKW